jgi:hypothetical protein
MAVPEVKSFVIADQVFRQESGKWCIIGVFDRILSSQFPARHPSMGLWLKLADASGKYSVRLEFQDSTGRVLSRVAGLQLDVQDRMAEPEVGIQTQNLMLPSPGAYFVKLFFNDHLAKTDIQITAAYPEKGK